MSVFDFAEFKSLDEFSFNSMHQATFGNNYSSFQQYTLAKADFVTKVLSIQIRLNFSFLTSCLKLPSNITFEQAASIPLTLATAIVGMYADRETPEVPHYTAPWVDGGESKYKGEPIIIFGGASSVGQFGEHYPSSRTIPFPF